MMTTKVHSRAEKSFGRKYQDCCMYETPVHPVGTSHMWDKNGVEEPGMHARVAVSGKSSDVIDRHAAGYQTKRCCSASMASMSKVASSLVRTARKRKRGSWWQWTANRGSVVVASTAVSPVIFLAIAQRCARHSCNVPSARLQSATTLHMAMGLPALAGAACKPGRRTCSSVLYPPPEAPIRQPFKPTRSRVPDCLRTHFHARQVLKSG